MSEPGYPQPAIRIRSMEVNPNHHLWINNGIWFMHYTVHPTPFTKERVRRSLRTREVEVARLRRDEILKSLVRPAPAPASDTVSA